MIDYRIFSDLGLANDVYVIVDSNSLTTEYLVQALTPGTTYSFKVAARNMYGYGAQSESVSVLAAQEPFEPLPPTSTLQGD